MEEGLANWHQETPTLFHNGRRPVSDLANEQLADAIQEKMERMREDE
jgi:hypothetical protein